MKRMMRNFMLLFSTILILGSISVGTSHAQEPENYLKLKGKVLNEQRADIVIYAQSNDEWVECSSKSNKSKYSLRLSTNKDYKIVFTYSDDATKTLFVKSGDPGMYLEFIDIDFKNKNSNKKYMLQKKHRYKFVDASKGNSIASLN